jgi:folate-binding protein YgfZ
MTPNSCFALCGIEMTPDPFFLAVAGGVIEASGPDAVRFVDNFTTAAVSKLAVGEGTESFFTDARGWVLALTTILRTESGLVILLDAPAVAATLREHLEHYLIREQLELKDVSAEHAQLGVVGRTAADRVAGLCGQPVPTPAAGHATCRLGDAAGRVVRVEGRGADGCRLLVPAGRGGEVAAILSAAGVAQGDQAAVDALRIAAAFPAPGDIPPKTLPQELGRDARAISFTKGCYLGQETVARLDALGHVNRRLVTLEIDAAAPPDVPATVHRHGTEAGVITSACVSPDTGGPLGLGLVSVKALADGGLDIGGAAARPLVLENRS